MGTSDISRCRYFVSTSAFISCTLKLILMITIYQACVPYISDSKMPVWIEFLAAGIRRLAVFREMALHYAMQEQIYVLLEWRH